MMPSTLQRRRAAYDFSQCYEDFCCSHGACPLSMVTARAKETFLECSGERVRPTDWIPLCRALQMNKSLETVKIAFDPSREQLGNSRRGQTAPAGVKPGTAGYQVAASRMDRSAVVTLICRALGSLVRVSPALAVLSFEGARVRFNDITLIAKGLSKSSQLQSLSLAHCHIGDSGAEVLCTALQSTRCLRHLDLTACSLTGKSAKPLTKLIEQYANWRYAYLWQASLRQVRASTDSVGGLRRITLCSNPLFGDRGVSMLMDMLQDDIWIKAVDMQHCGLTNIGIRLWLALLRSGNMSLMIVDLRQNPLADKSLIRAVMEQVVINGHGINDDLEFQWLSAVVSTGTTVGRNTRSSARSPRTPSGPRKPAAQAGQKTRNTKETPVRLPRAARSKSNESAPPARGHARSRSVDLRESRRSDQRHARHSTVDVGWQRSARTRHRPDRSRRRSEPVDDVEEEVVVIEAKRGLPWRTAARCALRKRARSAGASSIGLRFSPDEEERSSSSASESSSGSDDIITSRPSATSGAVLSGHSSGMHHHHRPGTAGDNTRSREVSAGLAPRQGSTPSRDRHSKPHSTHRHRRRYDGDDYDGDLRDSRGHVEGTAALNETFTTEPSPGLARFRPARSSSPVQVDADRLQRDHFAEQDVPLEAFGVHVNGEDDGADEPRHHASDPVRYDRYSQNSRLTNRNIAGLQQQTSLDDQLLHRFESALNKFSEYLAVMKSH